MFILPPKIDMCYIYFFFTPLFLCFILQRAYSSPFCQNPLDVVNAGPTVHGKVLKQRVLPTKYWWNVENRTFFNTMKNFITEQNLTLNVNKIVQDGKVPRYPIKLPRAAQCQVFINYEHRLIYVRHPKTAGSSLVVSLVKQCPKTINSTQNVCLDIKLVRPDILQIPDVQTAEDIWRNYFVFTGIRNPYARSASAYTYLLDRRTKSGTPERKECQTWPTFEQFCQAPFVIGMQSEKYHCINGDLPSYFNKDDIHDYFHVESQSPCIMNEQGEYYVDYIVSLENIAQDYTNLKNELLDRPGLDEVQKKYFRRFESVELQHHNAVSYESSYAWKMFQRCGRQCFDGLTAYYQEDFQALGYQNYTC